MKRIIVMLSAALLLLDVGFASGGTEPKVTPARPIPLLSQISTKNTYGAYAVAKMILYDNKLFTCGAGYYSPVYDVSDVFHPVKLYELENNFGTYSSIDIEDNKLYGFGYHLDIWDITNSITPRLIGGKQLWSSDSRDIDVKGNFAYALFSHDIGPMSSLYGKVDIWDISNPENVLELDNDIWSYYPFGPHPPRPNVIVASIDKLHIGQEGCRMYTISDPQVLNFAGEFGLKDRSGGMHNSPQDDMEVKSSLDLRDYRVYKAHSAFGIQAIFINEYPPDKFPYIEGWIGYPLIALGGNIAFHVKENDYYDEQKLLFVVTAKDQMFKVLDITDLNQPKLIAARSIRILGEENVGVEIKVDEERKLAFISITGSKSGYIKIYDLSSFFSDNGSGNKIEE